MRLINLYLILFLTLAISACSIFQTEKIVRVPELVKPKLDFASPIAPVSLTQMRFKVVNKDNLEEFLNDMESEQGFMVFIGMTVKDYETLSLNTSELRRYINQQKEVIIFYQNQITRLNTPPNKSQ